MILSKHWQIARKEAWGNLALSTTRQHDGETSGAKRNFVDTRTGSLGGEGKVVPKREYPMLELTLAGRGPEQPKQLHLEIQKLLPTVFCSPTARAESWGEFSLFKPMSG